MVRVKRKNKESTPETEAAVEQPCPSMLQKPSPTIDAVVHRLRHLHFHPKPILCLRSVHTEDDHVGYLALSRKNGSVELKSALKFRTLSTIAGYREKPVNVMAWLLAPSDNTNRPVFPTLVGASSDGTVFCIDFFQQCLTDVISSGGGAVFALTSICHRRAHISVQKRYKSFVAGGCLDGAVRIWNYNEQATPKLELVSTLPSTGAAVLSIAWSPNPGNEFGSTIYAAVADGTIRIFNENSNDALQWTSAHRMTVENMGKSIPTRVWALEALSDGTLISVDSLGHVQFWDGRSGTFEMSIDQNDTHADVLCLAISEDETKVFASGIDSRVIFIERIPSLNPSRQWSLVHAQRPHTHDVSSLAIICPPTVRKDLAHSSSEKSIVEFQEILCSGGLDTKLCTHPVVNVRRLRPRTLYPWQSGYISIARNRRVIFMRREESIDVYRLCDPNQSSHDLYPVDIEPDKTFLGTVRVEGGSNIVCVATTDDAKYLALSDAYSVKIFRLEFESENGIVIRMLPPNKILILVESEAAIGASTLSFGHNNHDLVCTSFDGKIRVLSIISDLCTGEEQHAKQTQIFGRQEVSKPAAAQSLCISSDNRFLAVMGGELDFSDIEVYHSNGNSFQHWWSIPHIDPAVCAMNFLLADKPQLAVACLNFSAYVFDVPERKLSKWSEDAGYPIKNLPLKFAERNDFPVYLAVHPGTPNEFIVASYGAFVLFDVDNPFPSQCRFFPELHVRGKKNPTQRPSTTLLTHESADLPAVVEGEENRAEVDSGPAPACTLCLRYNSMLALDYIAANELFVVEQPWLDVVSTFPDALERKMYGT